MNDKNKANMDTWIKISDDPRYLMGSKINLLSHKIRSHSIGQDFEKNVEEIAENYILI